jgi:hypothetical protein
VGGQLEVFHRGFELTDADEYTFVYQENNKHFFLMADPEAAAKALRAQVRRGWGEADAMVLGSGDSGRQRHNRGLVC